MANLMSNDCHRLVEVMRVLNLVWSAPLQICGCLILIYMDFGGRAVLCGFLVMLLLLLPLGGWLAGMKRSTEISQTKDKDRRIAILSEMLSGMKLFKLLAWESAFEVRLNEVRSNELAKTRHAAMLQAVLRLIWFLAPFIVITTFTMYIDHSAYLYIFR